MRSTEAAEARDRLEKHGESLIGGNHAGTSAILANDIALVCAWTRDLETELFEIGMGDDL